jgi:hypothetical protein
VEALKSAPCIKVGGLRFCVSMYVSVYFLNYSLTHLFSFFLFPCLTSTYKMEGAGRGGCEHTFHLACVRNQLSRGYVGARISFKFAQCSTCTKEMIHGALDAEVSERSRVK